MNAGIKDITLSLFENIPYSEQTEKAKIKITESLSSEYEKKLESCTEIQALGYVMSKFGTLRSAAALAGYSQEDISEWQSDNVTELKNLKKIFGKAKRNVYCSSLFISIGIMYLIEMFAWQNIWFLPFAAVTALIGLIPLRKFIKSINKFNIHNSSYSSESHEFLCKMSDRYGKRLINGFGISICFIIFLIFMVLEESTAAHMKTAEIIQYIFSYSTFIDAAIYICIKNFLCKRWVDNALYGKPDSGYRKNFAIISTISMIYWIAALILLLLKKSAAYIINVFLIFVLIYFAALLIYNLTFRKNIVFNNVTVNKKRIAAFALAFVVAVTYQTMRLDSWIIQPYISTVSSLNNTDNPIYYDEETGIYTITSLNDDFKILQLTDIHLGGSTVSARKDIKALKAVYKLIEYTEPDLVIVTGDLVFPMGIMSFSMNNYTPIMQFASFMRNIGIPWAFVYGNHDTELMATNSAEDLNDLFKSVSYKSSHNLLYPYIQPDITGRNNQIIEIRNSDGSLNQALFLIDSNAYTGNVINEYDYIHDDQVEWYEKNISRLNEQEGKTISSMAFFHIPLQEYREAYKLYEESSDEIKYFFGENGETMIDKVCCSDYPSKLFDTAVELNSTKAMFCGHDHYNNLSVEYQGIRLTYGMSIDYLAMPGIENDTEQRGGTLITLHPNSDFDIEQVKLTDIQ